MTRINDDLRDMTEQQHLTVEDILNQNFEAKKMEVTKFSAVDTNMDQDTHDILKLNNNNNINYLDKTPETQSLKRKLTKSTEVTESDLAIDKTLPTEINISIGRGPNKTIRLELRQPTAENGFKNGEELSNLSMESSEINYNNNVMKDDETEHSEKQMNGDVSVQNGDEYGVADDEDTADVSVL